MYTTTVPGRLCYYFHLQISSQVQKSEVTRSGFKFKMPDSRALAYSGIYYPTQVVWSWNLRSQSPEAAPPPGVKRTSSHCSLTSFPAPLHTRACRTGKQALPVPSTLPPLLQIVPLLNSAQREWACSLWAAETWTDERAMRRKKHPEPRPYDKGSAKAAGSKARAVPVVLNNPACRLSKFLYIVNKKAWFP